MAPSRSSSEFRIVLKILSCRLSNKSLNESRFSFHFFKMYVMSSGTKHESFDSFGSHTQLLNRKFPYLFFVMSLSSLLYLYFKNNNNQYKTRVFGGLF